MADHLYCGDNLIVRCDKIAPENVNLFSFDPPFNSNADDNALF
jgi:hypothetical protein